MVTGVTAGQGGSSPAVGGGGVEQKKPGENRRSNKPIMEKRRRARINNCLNELKTLILDAMKKDPARHSKLEKADILEMTVKHLEDLRSDSGGTSDRFRAGYRHCAAEVARFPGLESGLKRRLLSHLDTRASTQSESSVSSDSEEVAPPTPASPQSTILISAGPGSGVRLVPTRLSNGDIALVLPAGMGVGTLGAVPNLVPLSPRAGSSSSASSEPRCFSPESSGWGSPPPPPDDPLPLALVTRRQTSEERPWRPW